MSLLRSPVTPEAEGILRLLSTGPFAPDRSMVSPTWDDLCRRGYIRRNGVGNQGRVRFSITGSGERMLARCPRQ